MFTVKFKEPLDKFICFDTCKFFDNPIKCMDGKYREKCNYNNDNYVRDKIFEKKLFDFKNKYPRASNVDITNIKINLKNIKFDRLIHILKNDNDDKIKKFIWRIKDTNVTVGGFEIIHLIFKNCSLEICKEIVKKYIDEQRYDFNVKDIFGFGIINYVMIRDKELIKFTKQLYKVNHLQK
ncbi:MAG: hypothetical protein CMF62_02135 [Magnetococcales bacterium]|nr:hypothetical protein [Magnetococcales bacterium]|tara:strand:+ start:164309 stop:164848 length:540 start_codon:yes stop_codon:yes gene_type:complete